MQLWAAKRLAKSAITASRRRPSSLPAPHSHHPRPSGHLDHPLRFSHSDSAAAAAAAAAGVVAHPCSSRAAAAAPSPAAAAAPAAARIAGPIGEVQRRKWTWASGARHHTGTSVLPLGKSQTSEEVAARSEHKGGDPGASRRGEASQADGIEAQPFGLGSSENAGQGTGEGEDCGLLVDIYEAREVVLASRRRRKAELSHAGQERQQQQTASHVVGEVADVRMRQLTVKVYVDEAVRQALRLVKREKKGKLVLDVTAHNTLEAIRNEFDRQFPALGGVPLHLVARRMAPQKGEGKGRESEAIYLDGDESVAKFLLQQKRLVEHDLGLPELAKGIGGFSIYALLKPGARFGLKGSIDGIQGPDMSMGWRMLSMYAFNRIDDPWVVAGRLERILSQFHALGRVYVAEEGINAQVAVAHNLLQHLESVLGSIKELEGGRPNVDVEPLDGGYMPFVGLSVKVRKQVVSDALDGHQRLDWSNCGREVPPRAWHAAVEKAAKSPEGGGATNSGGGVRTVLLDCRNDYESDLGRFEGSTALGTQTFRDTWGRLEDVVGGEDREKTRVMIYCTGGIRCVKVGAYLTQKMGFRNVERLQGGIVAYARAVREENEEGSNPPAGEIGPDDGESSLRGKESLFRGINYVFDSRVGTVVTPTLPEEGLIALATAGETASDLGEIEATTSAIKSRDQEPASPQGGGLASKAKLSTAGASEIVGVVSGPDLEGDMVRLRRVKECIARVTDLAAAETAVGSGGQTANGSHLSGGGEGSSVLGVGGGAVGFGARRGVIASVRGAGASATGRIQERGLATSSHRASSAVSAEERGDAFCEAFTASPLTEDALMLQVLEGTREAYPRASHMCSGVVQGALLRMLCEVMGARRVLEIGCFTGYSAISLASASSVCEVVSLERDPRAAGIARENFSRSRNGGKIRIVEGDAMEQLVKMGDGQCGFDLAFLDADKLRYSEYRSLLAESGLLRVGGLLVADNVLWKGMAAEAWSAQQQKSQNPEGGLLGHSEAGRGVGEASTKVPRGPRVQDRHARIAGSMVGFLGGATEPDSRWEQVVLPMRDGLSISRRLR